MNKSKPGLRRGLARAGAATGAVAVVLAGAAVTPAYAAPPTMVLSSVSGPSGGGNSLTGTVTASAANPAPFPLGSTPMVQIQYVGTGATACAAAKKANQQIAASGVTTTAGVLTVDPANVKAISTTKIAFEVPSGAYPAIVDGNPSEINTTGLVLQSGQVTAKWNVCVYDAAGATLLATAAYTLAVRPKISSIIPLSSPASGGQTITVNGVGFTAGTATTATVGGLPLTGLKIAANGTSFTGVTPARTAGTGLAVTVNTAGGPVSSLDPDNNGLPEDADNDTPDTPIAFSYSNGITVTPSTAQAGKKVDISVKGVGFRQLTFNRAADATPLDTAAHVFLVRDAYHPSTNRGVQECKGVLVISNTELACTIDLTADRLDPGSSAPVTGTPVSEGTYTVTVVANGANTITPEEAQASIVSSGSTFTVGPY